MGNIMECDRCRLVSGEYELGNRDVMSYQQLLDTIAAENKVSHDG